MSYKDSTGPFELFVIYTSVDVVDNFRILLCRNRFFVHHDVKTI